MMEVCLTRTHLLHSTMALLYQALRPPRVTSLKICKMCIFLCIEHTCGIPGTKAHNKDCWLQKGGLGVTQWKSVLGSNLPSLQLTFPQL